MTLSKGAIIDFIVSTSIASFVVILAILVILRAKNAVSANMDKGKVLKQMEKLNVDILPVINDKKHFSGIVDRSRLTASLLIEMSENLNK